jgi:hypothetical protein
MINMRGPFKIRSQDNTQKLYRLNRLQVLFRQMLKWWLII